MKKQWRTPIILSALLVALILVWVGSTLLPGGTGPSDTTATTAELPIVYQADKDEVASIAVNNELGSYTLLPRIVTGEDGKTSISWYIEGLEDLPLSDTTTDSVVTVGTILYASKAISAGETDLAPFGLEDPKTQVTVKLKSGESHTISFGNELASGYFDYAILDKTGTIYSVSSSTIDKAELAVTDLLDKKQVIGIEDEDLTGLVFERARDGLKMTASCVYAEVNNSGTTATSYTFELTEPIAITGSADKLTTFATEALGLEVSKFVEIDPQDLSQYGLDQPQYTITLQTADGAVILRIGKAADDSSYYMMSDAMPVVFTAAKSSFTTIDMPLVEMIDKMFALKSIWLAKQVKVNLPGAVFTLDIAMEKEQKAEDEAVTFTMNGQDAKIFSEKKKSLFTNFYQRIIALQIAGADAGVTPVNTHDGSITFYMKADTENNLPAYTEVIEFARRDDYTYYVFIDGAFTGWYIDSADAFTSDETGYEGIVIAYKKMLYAMEHAVDGVFNTEEGYQLD